MRLKIAARKSDLARLQAYQVGASLKKAHPNLEVEYFFRESLGDKNLEDPLWKMPEKGVFTEDFLRGLIAGEFDLVVHSWKDLPTAHREYTEIAATLPRADSRDLILFKKSSLPELRRSSSLRLFSSSPRREHNLTPFLKDYLPFVVSCVEFKPVRGNIQTRIRKMLEADEVHGLVVAKAALDRLLSAEEPEFFEGQKQIRSMLSECHVMVTPLSLNPTAAAQGALAVEVSRTRPEIKGLVKSINCPASYHSADLERRWLARFGGGCHLKIGISVKAEAYGDLIFLRGLAPDGKHWNVARIERQDVPAKISRDQLWPWPEKKGGFFERHTLDPKIYQNKIRQAKALYIARESAWPEDLEVSPDTWVWTAGLETWKKLAKRGVWVHGTSDALGETRPELDILADVKIPWNKLTHRRAVKSETDIATYELQDAPQLPSLEGKTHFFWMSGSQFEKALAENPWLAQMNHACGPGRSFREIAQKIHDLSRVRVYLNYDHWWSELSEEK